MIVDAFKPTIAGGGKLSVTGTSQQLSLPAGGSIEITNTSAAETFFFQQAPPGTGAAPDNPTAVVDEGYYVSPGQCKIIRLWDGVTKLAYIGTGTGTARYSTGEGL